MSKYIRAQRCQLQPGSIVWHKSTRPDSMGQDCVEVGHCAPCKLYYVTDSKDRSALLVFDYAEWDAFVTGAKDGEFDLA